MRRPKDYCVVRIDNWFGHCWLNFSGKTLGALGVHKRDPVTFPPFVPSRVRSYTLFRLDEEENDYVSIDDRRPVHRWQNSGENLHNFVKHSFPHSSFFLVQQQYEGKSAREPHGICCGRRRVLDLVFGAVEGDRLETVQGNQYQGAGDWVLFGTVPGAFERAVSEEGYCALRARRSITAK